MKLICKCGSENAKIMSVKETIDGVDGLQMPGVNITYICNDCGYSHKEYQYLYKLENKRNALTVKVDVRRLDCIKNAIEVINNKVVCQGGFFSDYDKELLNALLGDNWMIEYAIGRKHI